MQSLLTKITALILFMICLPILIGMALLIIIIERDAVFFLQKRLGIHKKPFTIIKLRTMKNGHITTLGRVLRKTGIDELPQLINIIKGDITFIGPRPLTLDDVNRLNWTTDFYLSRWTVKPGLTGLAQLSPLCHRKMTVFWDNYYAKYQNIALDFRIISATVLTLFIGKKRVKLLIQNKLKK